LNHSGLRRSLFASGLVVALAAALATPVLAASGSTVVSGRPTWATRANFVRAAGSNERVDLDVVLGFRDAAGLNALAAAVSDPHSASYRHYLTPAQLRARFSQSDSAVQRVVSWLRTTGLKIEETPANHVYVRVSGTVAQAEAAFGTKLDYYRVGTRSVRGPASDPTIPSSLRGTVTAVEGLANNTAQPLSVPDAQPPALFRVGRPCSDYWGEKTATNKPPAYGVHEPYTPCGLTPQQVQGAYRVDKVIAGGIAGSGQTVAVVDAFHAPTMTEDLKIYSHRHGLPKPDLTQINATPLRGHRALKQGWYGEETLDLESVHSMAPGAKLLYEGAFNSSGAALLASIVDIVDNHRASIITNSYGQRGESGNHSAEEAVYTQAIAEGIGIYFSSGDCGDNLDPDGLCGGTGTRITDYPASSPNVTSVGGTSLAVGASNNYLFETGWGTGLSSLAHGDWSPTPPGLYLYGGGGGTSKAFAEPTYQQGVVPESMSGYWGGENRVVPDIAAVGDPNTGFLIGETQTFPDGSEHYSEFRLGGTSLSSPLMAGMMALANQAAGSDLGFVNPALYDVAGSDGFRDIVDPANQVATVRTNWNNGVDSSGGRSFSVRSMNFTGTIHTIPGYDDVTGLGTPVMPRLIKQLT
jgi:subtilase family serine protease